MTESLALDYLFQHPQNFIYIINGEKVVPAIDRFGFASLKIRAGVNSVEVVYESLPMRIFCYIYGAFLFVVLILNINIFNRYNQFKRWINNFNKMEAK